MAPTTPDPIPAEIPLAGMPCAVCQSEVQPRQLIRPCGVCGMPVHEACWEEAPGCGRPDCPAPKAPRAPAAARLPVPGPPEGPQGREGIGRMVVQLLICSLIPIVGPMPTIVAGFLWLDPANSPGRRRDGRILLVFGAISFVISLALVALQLSGVLNLVQQSK